jgi:hypothetical protein
MGKSRTRFPEARYRVGRCGCRGDAHGADIIAGQIFFE